MSNGTLETLESLLEEKERMLLGANRDVFTATEELSKNIMRFNKFVEEVAAVKKAIRAIERGK